MNAGIQIRIATSNDDQIISLLGRITFIETFGHLFIDPENLSNYLSATFSVDKIRRGLSKTENFFWLALVDGLPVGYAKLKTKSPTEFLQEQNGSQLQKIYVLKDFLSMKIGLQLQDTLIAKAQELKNNFMWLSVLHTNERAIRFYKKNDFTEIGTHNFQIGDQTFQFIAMAKQLEHES